MKAAEEIEIFAKRQETKIFLAPTPNVTLQRLFNLLFVDFGWGDGTRW